MNFNSLKKWGVGALVAPAINELKGAGFKFTARLVEEILKQVGVDVDIDGDGKVGFSKKTGRKK